MFDNGAEFQSQFHWHAEALDIKHVYIRPRTPRLNGKVERSHRVDDQEFYQLLDRDGISDDINGWSLFAHPHFLDTFESLVAEVERLRAKWAIRASDDLSPICIRCL